MSIGLSPIANNFAADRPHMMVAEANHRISNTLSAIAAVVRLNAADDEAVQHLRSPAEVRAFLREIGVRIDAAAQLHRLLAESERGGQVALAPYLSNIANSIMTANAGANRAILVQRLAANSVVPGDRALAIGLVVAELVANAVKYAHPTGVRGRIELISATHDGGVVVEVVDDGVGLPEGFNPRSAMSLGFTLMRALAEEAGGQLTFEQSGVGLRAKLTVSALGLEYAA